MDHSSTKRGVHPAQTQGRKNERHRNQTQSRNVPIPPRQRHNDTAYYQSEETSSQHNNTYYNDEQYTEQTSTQWDRQPSAHISEIESVDGSQQQQGDIEYEGYESDNRLIPAPRASYGDRQSYDGGEQSYEEVSWSLRCLWRAQLTYRSPLSNLDILVMPGSDKHKQLTGPRATEINFFR
jgi:hypothetical protein